MILLLAGRWKTAWIAAFIALAVSTSVAGEPERSRQTGGQEQASILEAERDRIEALRMKGRYQEAEKRARDFQESRPDSSGMAN